MSNTLWLFLTLPRIGRKSPSYRHRHRKSKNYFTLIHGQLVRSLLISIGAHQLRSHGHLRSHKIIRSIRVQNKNRTCKTFKSCLSFQCFILSLSLSLSPSLSLRSPSLPAPILVRRKMGLTWDLLGTHLGLTCLCVRTES